MRFSILHRHGHSEAADHVGDEMIAQMLAELDEDPGDVDHGDVWLTENATGWAIRRVRR